LGATGESDIDLVFHSEDKKLRIILEQEREKEKQLLIRKK
jgi:hypothetical protein